MLDPLLKAASSHYGVNIESYEILHRTNRTFVVSLQTTQGSFVLKSIYISEEKLRFILAVEQYLRSRGTNIPIIIPTLEGEPYLEWDDNHYVLQEKILGTSSLPLSPEAIASKATLLGNMHAVSLGLHSSFGPDYANEQYWEQKYDKKLTKISNWKDRYSETRASKKKLISEYLDFFQESGRECFQLLRGHSQFQKWKDRPVYEHYISHGDFHSENILHAGDQFYIIDWEFACYDYPSKDIGRLLSSIMKRQHNWEQATFQNLLLHYIRQNPLNEWQMELLYLDLAFPHVFCRFLENRLYKDMSIEETVLFLQREYVKTCYLLEQLNG